MRFKIKDFSILFGGNFLSQIINLFATIFIARIYAPSDFGLNTLIVSFASVFALFSTFGLEYLIITDERQISLKILINSIKIIIINSCLSLGIFTLFYYLDLFSLKKLGLFSFPVFFIIVLFSSLNLVLKNWNIQNSNLKHISVSQVARISSRSFFQYTLSFIGPNYIWLSISEMISFITAVYFNFKVTSKEIISRLKTDNFSLMIQFIKNYKNSIFYLCTSNLLNKIGLILPSIVILNYFGEANSGYFALVMSVLSVPSLVIINIFGDLFQKELSSNVKNIKTIFYKNFNILLFISFVVFVIIFFASEQVFTIVYGENWSVSGKMSKYLSFIFFGQILVVPLSRLVYVLKKEYLKLYYDIFSLLSSIIPFYLSNSLGFSIYQSLIFYSILRVISYIIYLLILVKTLKNEDTSHMQ